MTHQSIRPVYKNQILASLSESDLARVAPHLSPVDLKLGRILFEAGDPVWTVYFLEEGLCSNVVALANGGTVEVGIIGRDGFVDVSAVLGTGHSLNRCVIQIAGSGFAIKSSILREQINESETLRSSLQRAVQGLLAQTSQTAACNRVHELEERLARWLMMCYDRIGANHLSITHEFLATMLGTRRSSVTVAAGILHKAGLIDYSRGRVTIQDRKGLQEAACECYQAVREEYSRLGLLQ
ncbi:MAG TPA: Crp/Fnr family transcriptional regulator [Edaphobacter sp.]|nr:Crp/Fnr family transcriptional regulator [Edaphobacter sp.]